MIRNLLFDMGNVLIRWDPERFVSRLNLPAADRALLVREVFGGVAWVRLDRGTATEDETAEAVCRRLPARLHGAAERLVRHWDDPPESVPGMLELVRELEGLGYGLYLLSNAGPRHAAYWPQWPVSACFADRRFISSDWKLLKPERAFYTAALDRFGLDGGECLFIDDNPVNVEAALEAGIADGVVFYGDTPELRRELRARGIPVAIE